MVEAHPYTLLVVLVEGGGGGADVHVGNVLPPVQHVTAVGVECTRLHTVSLGVMFLSSFLTKRDEGYLAIESCDNTVLVGGLHDLCRWSDPLFLVLVLKILDDVPAKLEVRHW